MRRATEMTTHRETTPTQIHTKSEIICFPPNLEDLGRRSCACRKSNSDILVMKSTEKWRRQRRTGRALRQQTVAAACDVAPDRRGRRHDLRHKLARRLNAYASWAPGRLSGVPWGTISALRSGLVPHSGKACCKLRHCACSPLRRFTAFHHMKFYAWSGRPSW